LKRYGKEKIRVVRRMHNAEGRVQNSILN